MSFWKKYIKFTICIEEFYQVHCIMPFPFTILSVCPKVAINVELYLAMAMNYYFQAMIGIKALQYLGLTLWNMKQKGFMLNKQIPTSLVNKYCFNKFCLAINVEFYLVVTMNYRFQTANAFAVNWTNFCCCPLQDVVEM